jgi:spore germination protein KC
MIKQFRLAFICFFICTLTIIPGCWDQAEIEELAIVRSIAIDYIEGERSPYFITLAVIRPGDIASGEGGGGSGGSPTRLYSGNGASIELALQETNFSLSRMIFLAHNEIILVSEAAARQGISSVMDFILRDNQMRLTNFVLIIPGTAHEILTQSEQLESGISEEILGLISQANKSSESEPQEVFVMMRQLCAPGQDTFTGVLHVGPQLKTVIPEIQERENDKEGSGATGGGGETGAGGGAERDQPKILTLSGTAAFRGDKMAGFLNHIETRGLLWLNGDIGQATISVPDPLRPAELVTLSIIRSQTKITPEIKNGNISFRVEVEIESNILSQTGFTDISTPETLKKLNSAKAAVIKVEIEKALQAMQSLETDLVGFGTMINRKDPKMFQKIGQEWPRIFRDVTFDIHVKANVRRTGQLSKPVPKFR